MQVIAKLNHLRMAPRKVRLVADLIRGKTLAQARVLLDFSLKNGALPFKKLLNSAAANAKNNFKLEEDNLFVDKVMVNEGPKLKRWRARSRGRAMRIEKKTSHIILILDEKKDMATKEAAAGKKEVSVQKTTKKTGQRNDEKIKIKSARPSKTAEPSSLLGKQRKIKKDK